MTGPDNVDQLIERYHEAERRRRRGRAWIAAAAAIGAAAVIIFGLPVEVWR